MASPPPPPVDIVTGAITLATWLVGARAAELVGPYAVIVLAAVLGSAWGASRSAPRTRVAALFAMVRVVGLALLVSMPLAELLAVHVGLTQRWMLGPVAALVGGIGEDWPAVIRWALDRARRIVERKGDTGQ